MSFDEELHAERARLNPDVQDRTFADEVVEMGGDPEDPEVWSLSTLEDGLADRIAGMIEPEKWRPADWMVRYAWPDGTQHVWTSTPLRYRDNDFYARQRRVDRKARKALRKHAVGDQTVLVGETELGHELYVFRDGFAAGQDGFRPRLKHVARLFA